MWKFALLASLAFIISACVATTPSGTATKVAVKTPPPRTSAPENIDQCRAGWAAYTRGRYSTALDLYGNCIETGNLTQASLARTYRNLGMAYRRMGDYETSLSYYDEAMALKPADIHYDYTNRGNTWSDMGQYDKALADFKTALALKPNDGAIIFNRGIVYERLGDRQAARDDFVRAHKLGHVSAELLNRLYVYGILKPRS